MHFLSPSSHEPQLIRRHLITFQKCFGLSSTHSKFFKLRSIHVISMAEMADADFVKTVLKLSKTNSIQPICQVFPMGHGWEKMEMGKSFFPVFVNKVFKYCQLTTHCLFLQQHQASASLLS